jgi:hypothetical protein
MMLSGFLMSGDCFSHFILSASSVMVAELRVALALLAVRHRFSPTMMVCVFVSLMYLGKPLCTCRHCCTCSKEMQGSTLTSRARNLGYTDIVLSGNASVENGDVFSRVFHPLSAHSRERTNLSLYVKGPTGHW